MFEEFDGLKGVAAIFTVAVLALTLSGIVIITIENQDNSKVDSIVLESLSSSSLLGNVIGTSEEQTVSVIVTLEEDSKEEVLADLQQEIASDDLKIKQDYETIEAFSGEINQKSLKELTKNSKVKSIKYDYPVTLTLSDSTVLIHSEDLNEVEVDSESIKGSGYSVCVVDTGVDYTHEALGSCNSTEFLNGSCSKVIAGFDVADNDDDPLDSNSHGTHVAGIVASEDSLYKGVAPEAKIVAVKVFPGSSSSTNVSNVIGGIDWCKSHAAAYNISVITLSLGDGVENSAACDSDVLAEAANSAVAAGIFVDASSGNNGYTSGINSPACASNVTSVGWSSKSDVISSSSNSGEILDLLAPGSSITSTVPGGFSSKSGTSMSAPHVAGAAVLLKQYWQLAYGITATPKQIANKLKLSGVMIDDSRNNLTFPRIDLLEAVKPYLNFTTTYDDVINENYVYVKINSDSPLTTAILQWSYPNDTLVNFSMTSLDDYTYAYNFTNLETGSYSYLVYANDSVGMLSVSENIEVTLEDSIPVVTVLNSGGVFNDGLHNFSVTATDSFAGIDTVLFILDNQTLSTVNDNDTYTATINLSEFAEGVKIISVVANNTQGNLNDTEAFNFTIDRTSPLIYSPSTFNESLSGQEDITFLVNASDDHLSAVYLEVDENHSMNLEVGETYNYTLTSNLTFSGVLQYRFHAIDDAGNLNSTAWFNLTITNTAPEILNLSPENNTVVEVGEETSFNVSAEDVDGDNLTYRWSFGEDGQSAVHTYEEIGAYLVAVNVSDDSDTVSSSLNLLVNDTTAPTVSNVVYDSEVHLESDLKQDITYSASDYSKFSSAVIEIAGSSYDSSCSGSTSLSCSNEIFNLTVGSYEFNVSVADNTTAAHQTKVTYSFTVTSCSDGVQNGDEEGVDCDGSCTTDCPIPEDDTPGNSGGSGGSGGGGNGATGDDVEEKVSDQASDVVKKNVGKNRVESNDVVEELSAEEVSAEEEPSNSFLTAGFITSVSNTLGTAGTIVVASLLVLSVLGGTSFLVFRKRKVKMINGRKVIISRKVTPLERKEM